MNGEKSYQFALGAGVAQGCPLSPLLFLFIGEPLTRMLENDERLKGVTIGEHEHKVGQFADDTAAMLEGYQHLKKLFEIVNKWERATGMACNRSKTALIQWEVPGKRRYLKSFFENSTSRNQAKSHMRYI